MTRYNDHSDSMLCGLLKSGEALASYDAFTEIYERYSPTLLTHAYNKCHDQDEACDLVQEVFTALWENREIREITDSLFGYLARSILYSFLNKLDHEKVREKYRLYESFFSAVSYDNADHLARMRQLMGLIEKEVEALPPKMRRVFKMCRYQGMTHKEIAKALGISESTVAGQVSRAMAIVRPKIPYFIILIWLGRPQ